MGLMTDRQLCAAAMCPLARAVRWGSVLRVSMARFEIDTPRRAAYFIGQVGHESLGLLRIEESLNYSAPRLQEVFGGYFTAEEGVQFARQPERIANRVYAHRNGNGSETSGDGWHYRGRGLIQCTGRSNYARMSVLLGLPLLACPQLLLEIEHAASSAAAYWRDNGLNALADAGDVLAISRKINLGSARARGTPNGLQNRIDRTRRALAALEAA